MSEISFDVVIVGAGVIGLSIARSLSEQGLSTVVLEKNIIVRNKIKFPNLKTKEDFVVWLMLLKKDYKFYAYDKYLTNWSDVKNSLSSSTVQKLNDGFKVYNQYMDFNIFKSLYYLLCLSFNYLKKK